MRLCSMHLFRVELINIGAWRELTERRNKQPPSTVQRVLRACGTSPPRCLESKRSSCWCLVLRHCASVILRLLIAKHIEHTPAVGIEHTRPLIYHATAFRVVLRWSPPAPTRSSVRCAAPAVHNAHPRTLYERTALFCMTAADPWTIHGTASRVNTRENRVEMRPQQGLHARWLVFIANGLTEASLHRRVRSHCPFLVVCIAALGRLCRPSLRPCRLPPSKSYSPSHYLLP